MKEKSTNLDAEVFSSMLGFGNIMLFLHSMYNIFWTKPSDVLIAIDLILLAIFIVLYLVDRKYKIFSKTIFLFSNILLISFSIIYFFKGGYSGPIFYYFLIVGFAYSILLSDFRRTFLLIFQCSLMVCLVLLQSTFPHLIQNYVEDSILSNTLITFLLVFSFVIYVAIIVRKHHDSAWKRISEQNIEAELKNLEIIRKNSELRKKSLQIDLINKKLNQMVVDRTAKIEKQNNRLVEYAFFNSHKVRGPLARVLGLVELIKNSQEEGEVKLYISKLEQSAAELDAVVSDINQILADQS